MNKAKAGSKKVVIMGAGPAGLGAAYKLAKNGYKVEVFESQNQVGGLAKTLVWNGYRFDIGGHRNYTKHPEVEKYWNEVLGNDFLKRSRLSRIYYKGKFFNYPLDPLNAITGLGILETFLIGLSYLYSKLFPVKPEISFNDWVSNRFGKRLFKHFFRSYTEKVWGISTDELSADWAAQRIKNLSFSKAIKDAFFKGGGKEIKTLIKEFKYPKLGPGMLYEKTAKIIEKHGGMVFLNTEVTSINIRTRRVKSSETRRVSSVKIKTPKGTKEIKGDEFISSIPLPDMLKILNPPLPSKIQKSINNLKFRDFLSVNLIINKKILFPDNWIYIHDPRVLLGRIQNYKNWSPYMIPKNAGNKTSLGLEYFCNKGDKFWNKDDKKLIELGKKELEIIGLAKASDVGDGFVYRNKDAYPVYGYNYQKHLNAVIPIIKSIKNFQTIGRGGLFRYNNQDHSTLSGFYAARNIMGGDFDVWGVNIKEEYGEEKKNTHLS